jgi:hypothetical protein
MVPLLKKASSAPQPTVSGLSSAGSVGEDTPRQLAERQRIRVCRAKWGAEKAGNEILAGVRHALTDAQAYIDSNIAGSWRVIELARSLRSDI